MTREAALDAAREVFERGGLRAVSLANVPGAEEHFDSDLCLRRALVLDAFRRPVAPVRAAVERADGGEAAFEGCIEALARSAYDDPSHVLLHLGLSYPGVAELLEPDDSYRDALTAAGAEMFGPLADKLRDAWGDELPQGIHPRRLSFLAFTSVHGFMGMKLAAEAIGNRILHTADDMVDELLRALGSPTTIMRQLAALNAVSKRLAGIRDEETLFREVPALLTSSLDVDSGVVVRAAPPPEPPAPAVDDSAQQDSTAQGDIALGRRAIAEQRSLIDAHAHGATIAAPYFCHGEVEGAIAGRVAAHGRTLDRRDVSRFETFATMVGLALENARWVDRIQAEKMSAMSRLVAGVAHDLNTPLGALLGAADVSDRALDKLTEAIEGADERKIARALSMLRDNHALTKSAGARVNERVQALKNFARLDESERKRANIHDGIDSTLVLLEQQLGGMTIDKHYGDVTELDCFPNELNQVFMNLALNAAAATDGSGTLTVTTTRDGDDVVVSFSDDGRGIATTERKRIFDPGYTRWKLDVGAGLGLSTCLRIVRRHGGRIDVESTPNVGSTFHVRIPSS
jgi:signal transduction histidine kinase